MDSQRVVCGQQCLMSLYIDFRRNLESVACPRPWLLGMSWGSKEGTNPRDLGVGVNLALRCQSLGGSGGWDGQDDSPLGVQLAELYKSGPVLWLLAMPICKQLPFWGRRRVIQRGHWSLRKTWSPSGASKWVSLAAEAQTLAALLFSGYTLGLEVQKWLGHSPLVAYRPSKEAEGLRGDCHERRARVR